MPEIKEENSFSDEDQNLNFEDINTDRLNQTDIQYTRGFSVSIRSSLMNSNWTYIKPRVPQNLNEKVNSQEIQESQ